MLKKFFELFYLEVKRCFRYRPVLKFELPSTYRYRSFIQRYLSLQSIHFPIQNLGSSCNKFKSVFLPYLSHQRHSTVIL